VDHIFGADHGKAISWRKISSHPSVKVREDQVSMRENEAIEFADSLLQKFETPLLSSGNKS
jgi:hypothetical protein